MFWEIGNYSAKFSVITKVPKSGQLHQSEPKMVHVTGRKRGKTCNWQEVRERIRLVESAGKREIGGKLGKMVTAGGKRGKTGNCWKSSENQVARLLAITQKESEGKYSTSLSWRKKCLPFLGKPPCTIWMHPRYCRKEYLEVEFACRKQSRKTVRKEQKEHVYTGLQCKSTKLGLACY